MKVSEVKYARKFNTGNYESEEYSVTAIVEEDDSATEVFKQLKTEVASAHSGSAQGETNEEETTAEDQPTCGRRPKKGKGSDSDESKASEEETEEVEGEEEAEETEAGNDEPEEEETPDESEEKPLKKSRRSTDGAEAGKAGGKKFKKKPQVYQRSNKAHKDIFSSVLKEVAPDWKKTPASTAKGKSVSQKMEGEEFLDENGKVLATFKQSVKKAMVKK